jgi:hypothetical protein
MDDFISVYDDVLSLDECNSFIEYINQIEGKSLLFKDQEGERSHKINQKAINFSQHYNLTAWTWIGDKFFPIIKDCVDDYLNTYSILLRGKFLIYDVKAKKIPPGGGFHDWHYENTDSLSSSRAFVVQLYLNTIEEGGETEFLYLNKRVSSKAGRLIIFPSGFTHTHRGNPPIQQTKYILTSWALSQS